MQPRPLEPELEALLYRLDPGASAQWQGATHQQIQQIEQLTGRPLPDFYHWFLDRMGRDMGPLAYATVDFSAARILEYYQQANIPPDPRYLLIGYESDEVVPMHFFYDLDRPARGDARVVKRYASGEEVHGQFETLREMLAWGEFTRRRVKAQPQHCRGSLRGSGGTILSQLAPILTTLGFTQPVPTGDCCGLFEREDAALASSATPEDEAEEFQFFRLGAPDTATIRRLIGTISAETTLTVKIRSWDPPLP